jgi:hypothetical protein
MRRASHLRVPIRPAAASEPTDITDLTARKVIPMALDEEAQRILVAFRVPGKLAAFSARDGGSVASVELCDDADDLFVDAKRSRIYVSCGEGFIDIFDARARVTVAVWPASQR